MMKFDIPYPPTKAGMAAWCRRYGMNAFYSGKHWSVRDAAAKELHQMAILAMKQEHIPKKPAERPVKVMFLWDDRMDIDNHAFIGKAILDAMKGYVVKDDNRRCVCGVSHQFWNGGCIRVIVEEDGYEPG